MAFRGVLPEVPSFGTQLARGLGAGIGAGVGSAGEMLAKSLESQMRANKIQSLLGNRNVATNQDLQDKQFLDLLPQLEQKKGSDLTPADIDQAWKSFTSQGQQQQQPDQASLLEQQGVAAIAMNEPEVGKYFLDQAASIKKQERKELFEREKIGEPKIEALQEKLESAEDTGLKFDRLNVLFSPDLEDKFPPAFTAAMFTKDGELRPVAASQLSPEAQESVKLVADELKGAKDSFGARVTNFDLQAYMKRLPTLLNTAEGRRRVLRDLRMMNKLNQMEYSGTLDVINRYGGAGKISMSKAKEIFKKEFAPKKKMIAEEFVNPGTNVFEFPEFYTGRKIEDEETGQILISNGSEWVPQ
jgi:hypothetical protein